ncbi:MAG TPA: redoxin domain-containing protein [Verrucomicrobiae bacterium]|nr:redoxin domain-containing protein [Verrucomicrobiae bacterium]
MKKIISFLAVTMIGSALAFGEAVVGKPAPAFTAKDINGKTHKLSDYKGKIVVLEEYNLDCPFCANQFKSGAMQESQSYAASKGVVWLLVDSAGAKTPSYRNPAAARKEFAEEKIKAAAWIDDSSGDIGKAYGLKTTPHMIVIDRNGVVAYNGAIDDTPATEGDPRKARNYVREAIDQLLAGQKPKVTSTKPYGCGVKYAE